MSVSVDPITRSVVQHRLSSIVTEMGEAMLRTLAAPLPAAELKRAVAAYNRDASAQAYLAALGLTGTD